MDEDGELPACIEGDCLIPELDETGNRIMAIREKIISLSGLVDSGSILKMYDADLDDIEMLAFVEEEIKKLKPEKEDG